MSIRFISVAWQELRDAIAYYEAEQVGSGSRLEMEVQQVLQLIKEFPEIGLKDTKRTRRIVLSRFPYKIVYLIIDKQLVVIAFVHMHRKPDYWIGRREPSQTGKSRKKR